MKGHQLCGSHSRSHWSYRCQLDGQQDRFHTLSFNQKVRVMAVSSNVNATSENSYRPYQAYLGSEKYPLTHDVYILINDPKERFHRRDDISDRRPWATDYPGSRDWCPQHNWIRVVNVKEDF